MENDITRNTVELEELITKRIKLLETLKAKLTSQADTFPHGKLHTIRRGKYLSYYNRENPSEKTGKYIKKSEIQLAYALAQKEYTENLLRQIKRQLYVLNHINRLDLSLSYSSLSDEKQALVTPLSTNEIYLRNWQMVEYSTRSFEDTTTEFYTARDERVRSKSECLIADTLNRLEIPYRYEYPVKISGLNNYHPDFLCLNVKKRKEIIWEHFGLMDNSNYQNSVAYKIKCLTMDGYRMGEDFVFTMETDAEPLSTKVVEKTIHQYLM